VTLGSSAANVTVTVTTTPPSTGQPPGGFMATGIPRSPGSRELFTLALLLAATAAWAKGRRNPIRVRCRRSNIVLLVAGLLLALALVGCGGERNPGTPAGTYALTVTAVTGSGSSALSHCVTVTLNVT
jgi:hypothetical protein